MADQEKEFEVDIEGVKYPVQKQIFELIYNISIERNKYLELIKKHHIEIK